LKATISATLAAARGPLSLPEAKRRYDLALADLEKSRESEDPDEKVLENFLAAKADLADAQKRTAPPTIPGSAHDTFMDMEARRLEKERKEYEEEAKKLAEIAMTKETVEHKKHRDAIEAAKDRLAQVDIAFILDCTYSMDRYVLQAKECINEIVKFFASGRAAERYYKFRFACVGYRDHKDVNQYEIKDFTQDPEEITNFIDALKCVGGDDVAEDLTGGLFQSLILTWKSKTRLAFILTDAPPHGKKYHDGVSDDYSEGDPNGRNPEALLQEMRALEMDVFVSDIHPRTRKMFSVFEEAYNDRQADRVLVKLDLADDPSKFKPKVIYSIQQSMTSTLTRSTKKADAAKKYK